MSSDISTQRSRPGAVVPRLVTQLSTAFLVVVLIATGSFATLDPPPVRRTDPHGDAHADVWRTSKRKVVTAGAPTRFFFRVAGTLGPDWHVLVHLDTRGGPEADYRLYQYQDLGTHACRGSRVDGEPITLRCGLLWDGYLARIVWAIPRPQLAIDHPIRWKIHTSYPGDYPDTSHDDHAPDAGWYP
jgi:hypothetical protein